MEALPIGALFEPKKGQTSALEASRLTQQDFLQIFVAQLRNQNPMEPDSNGEFIAQLAQFDSLVSLNNINDTLSALQGSSLLGEASGLIGRTIVAEPDPGGDPVTGIVDGIELDGGEVLLQVDGQLVPVGTVRVVRDA